jgi:hypothetical protein
MNNIQDVDEFLEHHGVRGQKWGIRNKRKSGPSRRDVRKHKKQQVQKLRMDKANHLVETATKDPQVLIKLNRRHVVTGEEFINHLSRGGLLDIDGSDIWAQQEKPGGPYVMR